MTRVIAHRGASAYRPENTLSAYQLAVEQGADMIEIDLHRTRDGAVVVLHDENLEGLGGRGPVGAASLAALRALDAGDGQRVPTLDEVLDRFGARIPFNLEIKCPESGPYPGLEEAALAAVRERGLLERSLFSCFADPVLARLRALEPAARLGLLLSPRDAARPLERAAALGAEALHPWRGLAEPALLEAARRAGLASYVFTVDEEEEMRRLLAAGASGLFTNRPDRMRRLLDASSSPGGQSSSSE